MSSYFIENNVVLKITDNGDGTSALVTFEPEDPEYETELENAQKYISNANK